MSRFANLEFEGESDHQPPSPRALVKDEAYYLSEAQTAFENGEFEPALRRFAKVIEFNPSNATAWTGQVRALLELGEYHEAKMWADKALELFPGEPELLAAKGVALARAGDLHAALTFSDAAIAECGNTPYVWLARGDVLLARDAPSADYCFDKALSLKPGDWIVRWLAARIRAHYEQFALALKLLQQALEVNGAHFLLWLELGRCQTALGLVSPARHSLEQALQINPRSILVHQAIAAAADTGVGGRLAGWWRRLFPR